MGVIRAIAGWAGASHRRGATARRPEEGGLDDQDALIRRLATLRTEHRDLDSAIAALIETGGHDQLGIARLKKRKRALRDEIGLIEDQLIPDIIA